MRLAAGTDPAQSRGRAALLTNNGKVVPNTRRQATWPRRRSNTSHFTVILTFISDLACVAHVAAFALSPS